MDVVDAVSSSRSRASSRPAFEMHGRSFPQQPPIGQPRPPQTAPTVNMVLALALKAELNGVTDLRPLDTEDSPFYYTFKVQCTSCRETHPNWVSVSRFEQNEISGSKGEANFVWKCKNCKVFLTGLNLHSTMLTLPQREHSANIKAAPATYERTDPPKMKNILEFDCRGLEFVEFKADVCACARHGKTQD